MNKPLQNLKVLITAGPTREYLDPVRYISNDSTGKMGYAMAQVAKELGANVTLVSGPTNLEKPDGVSFISVLSAAEMFEMTLSNSATADIIICAAAVSDYRPKEIQRNKIKKSAELTLNLTKTADILKELGKIKRKGQILVGFALETENMLANAQAKLLDKGCDLIAANGPANIGSNEASVVLIDKSGKEIILEEQTKENLAVQILNALI